MNFEDLTPEQQEKARACKTPEEMLELAKAACYELSDAELDGIAGGAWAYDNYRNKIGGH
jgi:organic hydroperoxide reductase OsmC/OhrA